LTTSYQHVDRPEPRLGLAHSVGYLAIVEHIELQAEGAVSMFRNKIRDRRRVARGHHGVPSAGQNRPCEFAAKAAGASGYEPNRHFKSQK
jgi:hypothetical protein